MRRTGQGRADASPAAGRPCRVRGWSAAATAGALDDRDRGAECRLDVEVRGIEHVGIGGRLERGGGPARVALVAAQDVGEHLRLVDIAAGRPQLGGAPARARLGVAVTKIFTSASGKTTVPMSRPSSTAPGGARPKLRWNASSAARTSGTAETSDAASPTAWLLSTASSKRAGSSASAAATARARLVGEWPASSRDFATAR